MSQVCRCRELANLSNWWQTLCVWAGSVPLTPGLPVFAHVCQRRDMANIPNWWQKLGVWAEVDPPAPGLPVFAHVCQSPAAGTGPDTGTGASPHVQTSAEPPLGPARPSWQRKWASPTWGEAHFAAQIRVRRGWWPRRSWRSSPPDTPGHIPGPPADRSSFGRWQRPGRQAGFARRPPGRPAWCRPS